MTERDRIRAFERELERRCANLTEPTAFGTAFVNPEFPLRYDSSFVWVERSVRGVDADSLAADADRVLGEHGVAHREIYVDDDAEGARLAPGFLDLGWSADHLVIMAQRRPPEPRPHVEVREVGFDRARPVIEAVLRARPDVRDEEEVRQLVDFRGLLERRVGARFFVGLSEGAPVGVCEVYAFDGVAQIEDVNTLDGFRGRGVGSAVVLGAARWARARGCEVVFLVADAADWPKDLYARLGFDPVDRFWSFLRTPRP
jgi:GNAT superfamily N-acetyltransferase